MTTPVATILTTLILTVTTVYGQIYEPLDLAKKIFAKDSFPNIDKYITGEYKGRPNRQDLQSGSTTKFALLCKLPQKQYDLKVEKSTKFKLYKNEEKQIQPRTN